ncbi:MAG: hypothetical protein LWX52_00565 [Deltaproteobacteria bacterium]|jgi:hypothetical protein|nr:hypothetical protein [Deltaproteobacteria bacterium]
MSKKLTILFLGMVFVASSAFAGNIPEFDTVGDDSTNVFNDAIKDCVVAAHNQINLASDWFLPVTALMDCLELRNDDPSSLPTGEYFTAQETFYTTAANAAPDPCFDVCLGGYESNKTGPWVQTSYQWLIVLQMMPETDLDLNIRDCVLKENQRDIWFYAQQTGRYRRGDGKLVFQRNMNPRVTVCAVPGPKASPGFTKAFHMDARKMPNLGLTCLDNKLYTSKALWEEGIVMTMPVHNGTSVGGDPQYVLREGDMMLVTFNIPFNNPVDIWYGPDNVVIKYVGIIGMEMTS